MTPPPCRYCGVDVYDPAGTFCKVHLAELPGDLRYHGGGDTVAWLRTALRYLRRLHGKHDPEAIPAANPARYGRWAWLLWRWR